MYMKSRVGLLVQADVSHGLFRFLFRGEAIRFYPFRRLADVLLAKKANFVRVKGLSIVSVTFFSTTVLKVVVCRPAPVHGALVTSP